MLIGASAGAALLLYTVPAFAAPAPKATGGLTLGSPNQQISFNAFDYGDADEDKGNVEYQNFEHPGGLHYKSDVLCANVSGNDARFMWQIPDGFPGLSGLYVIAHVQDNGSPGTNGDIYGHTSTAAVKTALTLCENGDIDGPAFTYYPITGGNLVVHN